VGLFLGLFPVFLPLPFYMMGIFVSVVQAFVFTLLSMVYVALATAHDH
jgi:F-type H+-transporting ATPase subunit a